MVAAAAAKSLQSCLTLCDPIDGSPPGFPVPGILQARTLEWVAISFSKAWKWEVKVKSLSCVRLFATPGTAVYQAPLSKRFSRREYWSGVPLPSPIYPWFSFNTLSLVDIDKEADQGNLSKIAVPHRRWAFIETRGEKSPWSAFTAQEPHPAKPPFYFMTLPHFWPKTFVHIINWTWLQITSGDSLLCLNFFNAPK